MMTHLSNAELQAFLGRTMSPDRLLEVDDHLAACSRCRAALEREAQPAVLLAQMESEFEPEGSHLSYESLRTLAEGGAVPEEMARHAATCSVCAAELADLKQFVSDLAQTPRAAVSVRAKASSRPIYMRPIFYGAMAAGLAIVAFSLFLRHTSQPQSVVATVTLHDGPSELSLDNAGQLHGAEALSDEDRHRIRVALQTGRLELASGYASQPRTETILGPEAKSISFNLLSPRAEVVPDDRPSFAWQPLAGAETYTVAVYGVGYRKLMESPALTTPTWQPNQALPTGATYTWTVTAHTAHSIVREPSPPQAEASFTIMPTAQADALRQQTQAHSEDPLLLAALYAQAGAVTKGREQIDQITAQNPGSALAESLRNSLAQAPSPVKRNAAQ